MKYYRFDNSRSSKFPQILWGVVNDNGLKTIGGGQYAGVPKDSTEVSEAEYNQVAQSDLANRDINVNDRVVVLEYTPSKRRYGIVKEIYVSGKGETYEHRRVRLDNGDTWSMREVRLDTFIHRLDQLK